MKHETEGADKVTVEEEILESAEVGGVAILKQKLCIEKYLQKFKKIPQSES